MAGRCLSFREFSKILKRNGYELNRIKGDHYIWSKKNCENIVINVKPNPLVIERLIKTYALEV